MHWPDLSSVLGQTPFAVVGAVATRLYAPERSTRDLDVVVVPEDAAAVREKLHSAKWQSVGELSIGASFWRSPVGEELKVSQGRESWWPQAIAQAQENRDAQGLPILPLPYLVLMKFQSARTVDIGDITRMLGAADGSTLDETRTLFAEYVADGLEDLGSLIQLGQLEMQSDL